MSISDLCLNDVELRAGGIVRSSANKATLRALQNLLRERGRLSKAIIDQCEALPCHSTIANRFGGLMAAYRLIGYWPHPYCFGHHRNLSDDEMLEALRKLLRKQGYLAQVSLEKRGVPSLHAYNQRFGGLLPAYKKIGYGHWNGRGRGDGDKRR
jgi:hypothetical protein